MGSSNDCGFHRSVEELVEFLGGNYGRNFAKSHGQSVQQ